MLPNGVHYIGDVFSGVDEPMFVDLVHVSGVGNRIIAEEMLNDLMDSLCQRLPDSASNNSRELVRKACAN